MSDARRRIGRAFGRPPLGFGKAGICAGLSSSITGDGTISLEFSTPSIVARTVVYLAQFAFRPEAEAALRGVLYSAWHGFTLIFLRFVVGNHPRSDRHCAFHSAPPRYLLALCHPVSGMDWCAGLHRRRGYSGRRSAPHILSGFSAAPPDSRTGTRHYR